MSVEVRFRPMDLMTAEKQVFQTAESWECLDDKTLLLYDENDDQIALIHPDRWDSVETLVE